MHRRLGSATLSKLAFPGDRKPNFPWEKSQQLIGWDLVIGLSPIVDPGLKAFGNIQPCKVPDPPSDSVRQLLRELINDRQFHWSAPLVSRSNWSDGTESNIGSGPLSDSVRLSDQLLWEPHIYKTQSASLVSCSNWSDRRTECYGGSRPEDVIWTVFTFVGFKPLVLAIVTWSKYNSFVFSRGEDLQWRRFCLWRRVRPPLMHFLSLEESKTSFDAFSVFRRE